MKFSKRNLLFLALITMVALLLAGCGGTSQPAEEKEGTEQPAETIFINIATGGTAGVYYPLGGAMAEILNSNIEGVNATAESTGASVANINMLKDDAVQIAFVQNDIAYYAANGTEMFKDNKVDAIKGLCTLYPETIQIVTLDKSGIQTLADLKGKRVAVGAAGSGTEANARQILAENDITYEDIKVQYLSFAEAASNLKDGNVDAAFVTAGHPTAAIQDIAAQHNVVLLPVPGDTADKLIEKYPFYTKLIIPAGTYPNVEQDVEAVSVQAMLVVSDAMDEEMVNKIASAIYGNLDAVKAAHSVGALVTKESAQDGMSVPLHPGAEKYFQ
ncbi:MAG TPA: C4-dicarboxylate ABC transporter substrate-binding protein [Desulfotomaculum sp.]|nr:MAG: C4-dicarboxylate ABC transporter substrate-binding protein [Peptococcaceae bacterium BRH_c8a]KJS75286.1 MAG: C4-dicarboxylate ABC transporter substrate-binding protein [Desulfotomaculum sp. BICA1-6]HBX23836.1 C4-dicarboxylate ABC transporter substrate-binding protein [Desulfotomaculum sp.]